MDGSTGVKVFWLPLKKYWELDSDEKLSLLLWLQCVYSYEICKRCILRVGSVALSKHVTHYSFKCFSLLYLVFARIQRYMWIFAPKKKWRVNISMKSHSFTIPNVGSPEIGTDILDWKREIFLLHSPEIGTDVLDWKRWVFLLYSPEIGTDILNWKRRVCPNIPIWPGKKFGIVQILRIKIGNCHPYSENIVRFGENFRISFATFGAISELHSEKNSVLVLNIST